MHLLTQTLAQYAAQHLDDVNAWYSWPVNPRYLPTSVAVDSTATSFRQNVELKLGLSQAWRQADGEQRLHLVKYYVATWGGVRANAPATLQHYAQAPDEMLVGSGSKGVASWSKVMTMRDPERYAIYDARVAVALNALQIARQLPERVFFPVLSSQNKQIKACNPRLRALAKADGWRQLPDDGFYNAYLSLLRDSAAQFDAARRPPLYALEMLLFAKAEALLQEANLSSPQD